MQDMYPTVQDFDRPQAVARVQHLIESKFARDGRFAPMGFVMWRDPVDGRSRVEVSTDLALIPRIEDQQEALRELCGRLTGAYAVFHAAECWMPETPADPEEERKIALLYQRGRLDEVPNCQDGVLLLTDVVGEGLAGWCGLIVRGESCSPRIPRWDPAAVEQTFRPYLPQTDPLVLPC